MMLHGYYMDVSCKCLVMLKLDIILVLGQALGTTTDNGFVLIYTHILKNCNIVSAQSVISEHGCSRDMNPVYLVRIENRQEDGSLQK